MNVLNGKLRNKQIITVHPEGTMVVPLLFVETFNSNPNFTQKHKFQPHGRARGNVRVSPKSLGFLLWEIHNVELFY